MNIDIFSFLRDNLEERILKNKEHDLFNEHRSFRTKFQKEEWRNIYTRNQRQSLRKTALGFSGKQGLREDDDLWQYGNRLIIVYDKINAILNQLDINEENYETVDFDLVRLAGLLFIERDLIDKNSNTRQHKHLLPSAFDIIIPIVHQKQPELGLEEFYKIYTEMWDYFPYKPVALKKPELIDKLNKAIQEQQFSREWLGKEKEIEEIGEIDIKFFVDRMFQELFNIW